MSYYILPKNHTKIKESDIELISSNHSNFSISISKSLCEYVMNTKGKIDSYSLQWDNFKKYTNPYEYIHTIVPNCRTPVAKHKPLSRSYYKFIEITNLLHILEPFDLENIKSFHLAEGPGGFIEAINNLRNNRNDVYYGMTLIDECDVNIPGWKKSQAFLEKHSNIILEKGATGDGNLYESTNLLSCYQKYANSMHIITGDGGFDFSVNYNDQEALSVKLILSQILYALVMQRCGGAFILKIFDVFSKPTIDCISLLTSFYNQVYIVKPNTSRYANSERYLVCKDFRFTNTSFLLKKFLSILEQVRSESYVNQILSINIPHILNSRIEEINAIFGQQQIESINNTIGLIEHNKSEKLEQIKKNNIQKCTNWCIKHKVAYHKIIPQHNIFLSRDA